MARLDLKAFARRGAEARVAEVNAELAEIYRAFPSLRHNHDAPFTRRSPRALREEAVREAVPARKRRKMTAAQRKAVGERMKKYWAAKKKAEK